MSGLVFNDNDIKIASDKPSRDIKKNNSGVSADAVSQSESYNKARKWGIAVAQEFINDANKYPLTEENDYEMTVQRRLLLSFTATVGFAEYAENDDLDGIAQKSFLDTLKCDDLKLYETAQDTGAFSFYYLAFRRGGDIVRRIGQTFAMLCSHDGDPIYQELGEALYCWFLSVVKQAKIEHN